MASVAVGRLSVCCMSGGHNPARLASILSLFGNLADEIVVAVEEPRALANHEAVRQVADKVLSFPPTESPDQPIPWLFRQCSGQWILNIDDDEVPSPALLEMLTATVARQDITHAWIARRWLFPSIDSYLAEPPWSTEWQLRLVLADERFLQFSDVFHRPVVAHGPGAFIDAPLWHLDTAVNPVERRRLKAIAYEHARPGMTISGRSHNQGLYVPELVPNVLVALVPCADKLVIDAVVACERWDSRRRRASLAFACADDIDRAWPGPPDADTLRNGRIAVAALPASMRAGVQETIDVYVTNEGGDTWRWGKEARPEIRLGYQWSRDGSWVHEPMALRTPLPADIRPGETQCVPVHVVPPSQPGRYELQLIVLHEGVGLFGSTGAVALEVREQELVAVIGLPRDVTETLVGLALPPEVEPVILLGNDSDHCAYGDYHSVPGLRSSLLEGLEDSGRLARGVRLSSRSLSVLRSARRYRRTKVTHDVRLMKLFDVLAHSRKLVIAGTDWPADAAPGREWWRVLATMLVARAMKVPVLVAVGIVPNDVGARDRLVRWLVARLSSPIDESVPTQPALRPDTALVPEPTDAEIFVESGDAVAALR